MHAAASATGCSKPRVPLDRRRARLRLPLPRARRRRGARRRSIPTSSGQVLTDFDLHLFGEGTHYRACEKLGAHRADDRRRRPACTSPCGRRTPSASASSATSTAGTAASHPMRRLVPSGVWEIFIPDLADGDLLQVRDPHARRAPARRRPIRTRVASRCRRSTASIVWTDGDYEWGDDDWMRDARRRATAGSSGRCRSTRCTSARGGACPRRATAF